MTTKLATGGKKRKLVNVHLLGGSEYVVQVDAKSKFQEVFNQVTGHLCLRETEYFGLAFKKDNEYQFVVLDEKIHKHAPKHWKSGPGDGVDSQGKPIISVWFRVQFYVDQVILLREKVTRHQYYLQLKDNVLQYNHVYSEEKCFQQAAYALQADFGNYVQEKHDSGYFNPALYFPHWIVERHGLDYLAHNVPTLHRDLHNMTRNEAELRYIKNASMPPGSLNLHFYMVRRRKTDKISNTWLAICAKGVEVYEDDAGYKNHVSTFMWRDIGKLYFDKKKFEIRTVQSAGGRRFIYYTDCDIKSKYLLSICRSTHMFQMAIQPKLMEIQHLDHEDQKRYRESYVSNDPRERSRFHHSPSTSTNASVSSNNNQRLSVVSDASSNTTSGIVSDRMAVSFDDGDDHSREIMTDCPASRPLRSKLQLFSSFSQSPHYGSQASPGHNLELCNLAGESGSSQEQTPGGTSWRARHSHTFGCLPVTPDNQSCLHVGRGYPKLAHRSVLQTVDRNTSGDSAVSVSGGLTPLDKLSPMLLLPTPEQQVRSSLPGDGVGRSTTASPCFSQTPPRNQLMNKIHGSSPSPFIATSASKAPSPLKLLTLDKPLNLQSEVTEKVNPHQTESHQEHSKSWAASRSDSEQMRYRPASSPQVPSQVLPPTGSHEDKVSEQLKLPAQAAQDIQVKGFSKIDTALPSRDGDDYSRKGQGGLTVQTTWPSHSQKPLADAPLNVENQHTVTAQVHQAAEPHQTYRLQQVPQNATDHYLIALQQGSDHSNIISQWGRTELLPHHLTAATHSQDQYHQTQQRQNLQSDKPHSVQSQSHIQSSYQQDAEDNKENVCERDKNADVRMVKQSHSKANLHPELKQILGQSHAFSLPLMTALCNDSTLMQTSRSQSGSRSSYETSTVRSTDSRLTRLSHDTDSRRWSSCCQGANMPDMLVQSSRPYSWHSEHLELDQLAVPSLDNLPPTSPPNPRSVNNKHFSAQNNHQNMLPQKMIVSDPGPSSPRLLTMGGGTCWWEAPPSASEIDGSLSSWTGIIPYNLPAHHQPVKHGSQQLGHHHHQVPHKLSSGGHRDSETSITHKQVMKENIGVA